MNQFESLFKNTTGQDFSSFYSEHKPKLIWYLSKLTGNLEEAEDFAEEAFVQGLHKLEQYDPGKGAQIHTWIYTIGKNLVIKSYKEKQKIPAISLDKEYDDNLTLSNFIAYEDTEHEQIDEIEVFKKAQLCEEAIYSLPEKYREVMIMRELQEMQYKQIAEKLDRNLSTVKSQIKKGRSLVMKRVERKFKAIKENGIEVEKKIPKLKLEEVFLEVEEFQNI
jgi:RNA polymerase sigma-70 factor (ECF subfamily)